MKEVVIVANLLDVEEFAKRFCVSSDTVYRWLRDRQHVVAKYAFKIGQKWLWRAEDIDRIIKEAQEAKYRNKLQQVAAA